MTKTITLSYVVDTMLEDEQLKEHFNRVSNNIINEQQSQATIPDVLLLKCEIKEIINERQTENII